MESKIDDVKVNNNQNNDSLVNSDISVIEKPLIVEQVEETISHEEDNDIINTPVWELPTEIQVETKTTTNTSSLPVWDKIVPSFETPVVSENNSEIDMVNIISKSDEDNNMFWIPVSDEKVESSSFPSLNLPINDKVNKNSEFVFPNINK